MNLRALPVLLVALLPLAACNTAPQSSSTPANSPSTAGAQSSPEANQRYSHSNRAIPQASAGSFDLYLLNLSWSPEYCHSHPTATECAQHDTFVLHGLWPENADGTYPSNCSNAPGPANPSQYSDLYPDPGLLQHEWQTHGTCSGLGPDAYFQTVRSAFKSVAIPPALGDLTSATSLSPAAIEADFTTSNPNLSQASLVVSCGGNSLTAVEVCLDKSLHATACPTALHSCRANTVKIPAPQS